MKTTNFVELAQEDVKELTRKIDLIVDEYLQKSKAPKNQRIVNVGRALNAYHVCWIANLGSMLEGHHEAIKANGLKSVKSFHAPKKEIKL